MSASREEEAIIVKSAMHRFPPPPRGLLPWALVALVVATGCARRPAPATDGADAVYMGSESCQACHVEIHARWQNTEEKLASKIEALEAKLVKKDNVIAEVSEEFVRLKKELGEP